MATGDATPGISRQYVAANGLDIYYEASGAGPPLVVLHAGTSTIRHRAALGNQFRVVAPNMRGHGRTANPTGTFSYPLLADDVAALIGALGLDRPLVVGYSDGGNTVLELGMRHPDLARALVIGAAWLTFSPTYVEGMRQVLGLVGDAESDLDLVEHTHPQWIAFWQAAHAALGGPDYWRQLLQEMWPMWMTPHDYAEADFRRITVPTLVLLGDRDETIP
jgi:pimeloyl-ACP methyl ester carboxylesterase